MGTYVRQGFLPRGHTRYVIAGLREIIASEFEEIWLIIHD
jgi:hypothetical protein